MKTIKWSVSIALMFALFSTVIKGFTIDGTAEADYGSAIVTQQLGTSTFKNTETNFDAANGSELDAAYGVVSNGVLYLFIAGNVDTGGTDLSGNAFDKLNIFFMTGPGGDHVLGTNYSAAADFGHINNMGVNGGSQQNGDPGLTFDTGFAANYWIGVTVGPAGSTTPKFNVNYEQICAFCPGAFLGATSNAPPGNFVSNATFGVQAALNNSNTNGVQMDLSGCEVNGAPFNPQNVRTGVELAIPLSAIGNPTGQVSVCAFITDDQYASMYNQVLAPINGGTLECQGSFGDASAVNFSTLPGTHTFTFTVPPCNAFLLSSTSASYGSSGGASNVTVADSGACSWNATSSVPWIVITSGGSGVGNGTITYSVSSNTSINARTGTLTIVGQFTTASVSISQAGLILPPLSGIIIDGTVDSGYGCPVAVQLLSTSFGKNTTTNFINDTAGSELDAAYGLVKDNTLFLLLAGNIQANGNRIHVFFMTGPGGENTLTNVNPNNFDVQSGRSVLNWLGPTNNIGTVGAGPGLTFDPGFAPNYYMNVSCSTTTSSFNYAQLWPGGTNSSGIATNGYFLGRTGSTNGTLTGGTNPFLIQATVNNSNTNGVDKGNASMGCYTNAAGVAGGNAAQALAVTTGVEMAIPLAALGSPTGTIAICAFVGNNGMGLQLSTQMLGSFGTNDPNYCLLGPGKTTNSWAPFLVMSNYPGQHFFYVGPEMRVTSVGVTNNNVNVSYLTENNTNLLYRVERITGSYSTNSIWVPVTGFVPGNGGIITQTDTLGGTNKPGAFYRVRQSPNCQ
jgi:Viral BACON domain